MKGRIILGTIGAILVAALIAMLSSFGLPPLFLIAWALLVVGVGVATHQLVTDDGTTWPPARPVRAGGSDVSRLAWAINTQTGVVGHALVRRVRAVAVHRLAVRGLDLDDTAHHPRIDALLGEGVRATLDARVILREDLDRVLDAIETLPPTLERE